MIRVREGHDSEISGLPVLQPRNREWREAGIRLRDALAKKMDPDQIADAQKLAQEWKPKGK